MSSKGTDFLRNSNRVGCWVKFTDAYGDIDEPFYISMESMYEKALKEIIKYGLKDTFQKRCQKIVLDTSEIVSSLHTK